MLRVIWKILKINIKMIMNKELKVLKKRYNSHAKIS